MPTASPLLYPLYAQWAPIIEAHKYTPFTEIEIRLGRAARGGFDTNVGKQVFEKTLAALGSFKGWESTSHNTCTVYYFPGNKRLSINEESEEQIGHIKKRVEVDDYVLDGKCLDVRLGISTEEPFEYDGDETSTEQKTRERWSFVRKNLSIDLSVVNGNPDDPDCDESIAYQVELEIVNPALVQSSIELANILNKVFNLLEI